MLFSYPVHPENLDFVDVYEELCFDGCLNITKQCLHIPILNDICLEEMEEFFYVFIESSFDCVGIVNSPQIVTIVDDDCEFQHVKSVSP